MSRQFQTITLLTDRGRADEAVGVAHSIVRDIAADTRVIDLGHEVPVHDVCSGSLMLARSAPYIVPGVVVASVDPDGSAARRSIAVEVGDGAGVLMGPDNGLLASAVAVVGGSGRCREIVSEKYRLVSPGQVCAFRDVLVPAAAHVANGIDIAELGDVVEPTTLLPSTLPMPRFENEQVISEVMWIDHYGKIQLNVDCDTLAHLGDTLILSFSGRTRTVTVHRSIVDIEDGQIGLAPDVHGMLAIATPQRSAAAELSLAVGTEVVIASAR
ncbi:MAG: SAM-dependent chlorinase/fluorinase [Actinomycetia bacterium]|nr:SAM-dependent chlorinase/fluorinase [Actinomycetes bacterium]